MATSASAPLPADFSFSLPDLSLPLPPKVLTHLRHLYATLFVLLSIATLTASLPLLTRFPPLSPHLSILAVLASITFFHLTPPTPANYFRRAAALAATAAAKGALLSPLIASAAIHVHPALPAAALAATASIFACFSMAALLAPRGKYLALGGLLGSAMSGLFWVGVVGMFWRTELGVAIQIYGGLLVFSGFVVVDTQKIVERADRGRGDVLGDALMLFVDMVALFQRILIILMRKEARKDTRARDRRSDARY
mmetsp:Transcript_7241/g.17739  ORF Transcript_7241/g.17739 Transcript_7241/m.17739 type:complete len:253 (+) Transcript_7241:130-888(+)